MRYTVIEFYHNLGIKVRAVQYDNKDEAFEHCGQLKWFIETPYILVDEAGNILDFECFDMEPKEMARLIDEEL